MQKNAVIFDMDGVLVDSYEPHYLSWVDTCGARGFPIDREKFAKLFGRSFGAFAEALSPRCLTETEIQEWYDEKELRYREIVEKDFPEIDGADDLIGELGKAGFAVGIASSGPRKNVECVMGRLKNAGFIMATVSANETTHTKPHPEPFLRCAEKLGIDPAQCVVIEDSVHGLEAGRAAGMRVIALAGTASKSELMTHADLVVESLRELNGAVIEALLTAKVLH